MILDAEAAEERGEPGEELLDEPDDDGEAPVVLAVVEGSRNGLDDDVVLEEPVGVLVRLVDDDLKVDGDFLAPEVDGV